jgi:hypothetical protein
VFLSLGRYLCWWTISPLEYHLPSSQCYYHWVDTSAGGILVPLEYHLPSSQCYYHWVDTSAGGILVPLDYHLPSSQCYYHLVDTSSVIETLTTGQMIL